MEFPGTESIPAEYYYSASDTVLLISVNLHKCSMRRRELLSFPFYRGQNGSKNLTCPKSATWLIVEPGPSAPKLVLLTMTFMQKTFLTEPHEVPSDFKFYCYTQLQK